MKGYSLDIADGRTRTGTAFATAPSRQRVYQIPPHRLIYNVNFREFEVIQQLNYYFDHLPL